MKTPRAIVLACAVCAFAGVSFAASADYFLKIDTIKGESSDNKHKDWIEILSVSVDADVVAPRDAASGLATGKRQHKPFVITKTVDKSSPKLAEACAKGTVLKEVEVGGPDVSYKLTDAIITSIQPSSGGDRPMESLSLNYTKIEMTYNKDKKDAARESPTRATDKATAGKPARAPN